MIRMPMTPVIRPPVRKLILLGQAFEKSYDGLTTFAATLVGQRRERQRQATVTSRRSGLSSLPASSTGSQIASP